MCDYYETNAEQYAAQTGFADLSDQYGRFLPLLKKGARILDVGSGSGRDAVRFQRQGYQVTALEPSGNLCREIRKIFTGETVCARIQDYRPAVRYDGIWACASLLHLKEEELLQFFACLDLYLKNGGVIYLSGKQGVPTGTGADGRFFLEFTGQLPEKILQTNADLKLEQLWYTGDVQGRQDFYWMNLIFRLQTTGGKHGHEKYPVFLPGV